MKTFTSFYFKISSILLLGTSTLFAQPRPGPGPITGSPVVIGGGSIRATNAPCAGCQLLTDGTIFYWGTGTNLAASVTNAVQTVQKDSATAPSGTNQARLMNFIPGTNVVLNMTNKGSGSVDIQINSASSSGSGAITNTGIIYVSSTGDDNTAQVDRMDKPYQNIDAASVILRSADNRAMLIFPGTYSVTNPIIMTNGSAVIGIGSVKLISYVSTVTNGTLFKLGNNSLVDNIIAIAAKTNVANYGQSFAGVYANATASKNDAFTNATVKNCKWIGDYDGLILVHSNLLTATVINYYGDTKGDGVLLGQTAGDVSSSNSVLIIKNSWLQITNASQNSPGYNPVGISIPYGKVILDSSTVFVRSPIGTTNKAINVDNNVSQDGRGMLEIVNSSIRSYSSNGVENGMQLFNGADTSIYNVTNVIVRGISDLNLSQTYGTINFGKSVVGASDIVIPTSKILTFQMEGDNVGVTRTNLITIRPGLITYTNAGVINSSWTQNAGPVTNINTLDQNGAARFNDEVKLGLVTPSTIVRVNASGNATDTLIGSGLSFDGTTLSATGGAGSSNYTTLGVGSITVGGIEVTNTTTLKGPLVRTVGQAPGTTTIVIDGSLNTRTSVLTSATTAIFSNMLAGQTVRWYVFSSNGSYAISFPQSLTNNTIDYPLPQPYTNTWSVYEATVLSSGMTNFSGQAQQYGLVSGWGLSLVTNEATRTISSVLTNRAASIATNAASVTVDFSDTANINEYNTWFHLTTNLVISPTNLVVGRTTKIYFNTNSLTFDVAITNTAANRINWNFNVATNGSTAFTKTNTMRARLYLTCETNGTLSADFGYYR